MGPKLLGPGSGLVEDNFCTDGVREGVLVQAVTRAMGSNGDLSAFRLLLCSLVPQQPGGLGNPALAPVV